MSWELNAALRGIPVPSIKEPAEEVHVEGIGGAVLVPDDNGAVVPRDALLEKASLEKARDEDDDDDGVDWSLAELDDDDNILEAWGAEMEWSASEGEGEGDDLDIIRDSPTTSYSFEEETHGRPEILQNFFQK
ncbi:hypothetical protein E4U43_003709 [Claviceps pusilla]|uniref:Uncharacterized protein n=1 Tax=Claviceps pusilla TaxID=123648 RepID=A0A9P7T207_9HYPO|nr:hypothetical protein E4U43_003709 [Claviceps pusilla]